MRRRRFLELGAASGALLLAEKDASAMTPHPPASPVPPLRGLAQEVEEKTAAELQDMMKSRRATAREIAEAYLERIRALDRDGPRLNSVIELNPDALDIADRLDAERARGQARGPLHGIPVLIKDNLDTGDRMQTSAGSLALVGEPAAKDSSVAAQLREAGVVILGKANLSEWANFRSANSTSGWSGRGGLVKNPYVLPRNACGSSSGSGAAVAASLAAIAIGTETDGSVVCPSNANGVVGVKPTLGLVSRAGIVPIAHSQDTAGPMARTVADAAALLNVMAAVDPRDEATAAARGNIAADYTAFLDPGALRGARIGVAHNLMQMGAPEERVFQEALKALQDAGAVLVDPADVPHFGEIGDPEWEVLLYEFKADLNAYLATRSGVPIATLADAIQFNEDHADQEMPWFGQDLFLRAEAKGPLSEQAYRDALAASKRFAGELGLDAVLKEHRLDALVAPTAGPAWMTDLVNGDAVSGESSTLAAVSGNLNVSVPMGYVHGLPVNLSFMGGKWTEGRLLGLAYAFEQATRARVKPGYREWDER